MTTDQMEQALLRLPAAERARLVDVLIASLDADPAVEAAWIAEVRGRDEQLRAGAPVEDASSSIRSRFGW
jgi:hypothetical protein